MGFSQKYYNLEEEELQALIVKAKESHSPSQERLLEVFDNFLSKYVSLLHTGKWDSSDYDIRRFVGLFVTEPGLRFYLRKNKLNDAARRKVDDTVKGIVFMVNRQASEEDVRQTVSLTFLQCVQRYSRRGDIPFSGFLYSYFFYMLKKNVDTYLVYQLGRKSYPLLDPHNTGEDIEPGMSGELDEYPTLEESLGPEVLDDAWVAGITSMFPFDQLTIQERQLVKWRFIDGIKISDIAKRTTEHPNTCREHIVKIREKLEDIWDEHLEDISQHV